MDHKNSGKPYKNDPLSPSELSRSIYRLIRRVIRIVLCVLYELQPIRPSDILWFGRYIYHNVGAMSIASFMISEFAYTRAVQSIGKISNRTWIVAVLWAAITFVSTLVGFSSLWMSISIFLLMVFNLGERKEGELSAYSVFNKGFKQLHGDFDAGDLDRQLRQNTVMGVGAQGDVDGLGDGLNFVGAEDAFHDHIIGDSENDKKDENSNEQRPKSRKSRKKLRRNYEQRLKRRAEIGELEDDQEEHNEI